MRGVVDGNQEVVWTKAGGRGSTTADVAGVGDHAGTRGDHRRGDAAAHIAPTRLTQRSLSHIVSA